MDSKELGRIGSETLLGTIKELVKLALRDREALEKRNRSEIVREILRMELALKKAEGYAKRGLTISARECLEKEIETWGDDEEWEDDAVEVLFLRDRIEKLANSIESD